MNVIATISNIFLEKNRYFQKEQMNFIDLNYSNDCFSKKLVLKITVKKSETIYGVNYHISCHVCLIRF